MRLFFTILLLTIVEETQLLAQKEVSDSIVMYLKLFKERKADGNLSGAVEELLRAEKHAEAGKDTNWLCQIQLEKGVIAAMTENNTSFEEAISKAELFCTACQDTNGLARAAFQNGVLCLKQKQNSKAIQCFTNAETYWRQIGNTVSAAAAIAKIGNTLEVEGRYLESLPYYLKYWEVAKQNPESYSYMTANVYLTGNYIYLKNAEKAEYHNAIVKRLSSTLQSDYEYAYSLRCDAMIAAVRKDFERAYKLLDRYLVYYQDTLLNAESLKQIESLKAGYENDKKEAQITLQKSQLGEERLRLWATAALLGLALIAGGFLYFLAKRLRKRNEEKEYLIKEIHHRVKNNLQILSSLLNLQSRHIKDEMALGAVREGQNRVDAMGLIHQKLYMGDNLAQVEMQDYLAHFGQNMLDSFGIDDGRVTIENQLDPIYLDVDTAIPLGLIINELVSNSLKYAFPDNRKGIITIALWQDEHRRLCLKVSDNGVGQAKAAVLKGSTSFGTNLVQMLSKKLKGKPEVLEQESGYTTFIAFENF